MKTYFERFKHLAADQADDFLVFLGFITIIPFISLGYSTFLYLLAMIGFDFWSSQDNARFVLEKTNIIYLTLLPATLISLLAVGCFVFKRNYRAALVIANALFLLLLGRALSGIDEGGGPNLQSATLVAFYIVLSIAIVLMVIARGSVSYPLTLAAVFVLVVESLSVLFGYYFSIFDMIFTNYAIAPINIFLMIILIFLIRGACKFYSENIDFFSSPEFSDERNKSYRTTTRLWWPMLLIFAVATGINFALQYFVFTPAIIAEIDRERLNLQEFQDVPADQVSSSVTQALERSLDAQGARFKGEIQAASKEISDLSNVNGDKIVPLTRSKLPSRFPGTKTRRCSWYDIVCHLKNGIKSMINSGYLSARESLLSDLQSQVDKAQAAEQDHKVATVNYLNSQTDTFIGRSKQRVIQVSKALALISALILLYSLLVLGKSFLVVFSRVFYSTNSIGVPTDTESSRKPGEIEVVGNVHVIDENQKEPVYLAFKVLGPNAIDRRRIPQALSLFFSRISFGKYVLCKVDMKDTAQKGSCEIKVDAPAEIIKWKINAGQEVFVNMRDLIGFSATCNLKRKISLHISSLVFGRIIYHSIQGPGEIYLVTNASALAGNSDGANSVMHSSSLLAWSSNAEFNIRSSLTKTDVFFSGFSIAKIPLKKYLVAYDTSQDRRVGSGRGIWRMIRTFLLPI